MDPALAALDFAKAGAILADMIASRLDPTRTGIAYRTVRHHRHARDRRRRLLRSRRVQRQPPRQPRIYGARGGAARLPPIPISDPKETSLFTRP